MGFESGGFVEPGDFESLAGDVAGGEEIGGGLLDGFVGGNVGFRLVFFAFGLFSAVKNYRDQAFGF